MLFGIFVLLVALIISGVAAYYSIAGLVAIFAAAATPIIIMGAALEVGKITATVWLHKYWNQASLQFKLYLIPAIAALMIITSMGIFGYLSKAHMDQSIPAGDVIAQVQIFDDKIKTERDNIEVNKKALQQMDMQVDQMLLRTDNEQGAIRAVKIRKQQLEERKSLQESIAQSQKTIVQLQSERSPISAQVRKVEAEVGPVKYIAALIYGDNPDSNLLERAVRWVIILLILVFDPLAVVLILAADQTFMWHKNPKEETKIKIDPNLEDIDSLDLEESLDILQPEETLNYLDKEPAAVINAELLAHQIRGGLLDFKNLTREEKEKVLEKLNYNEKRRLFE
jgi:hypothetical protein